MPTSNRQYRLQVWTTLRLTDLQVSWAAKEICAVCGKKLLSRELIFTFESCMQKLWAADEVLPRWTSPQYRRCHANKLASKLREATTAMPQQQSHRVSNRLIDWCVRHNVHLRRMLCHAAKLELWLTSWQATPDDRVWAQRRHTGTKRDNKTKIGSEMKMRGP